MTFSALNVPFAKVIAGIANTEWATSQVVVEAAEAARQQNPAVALDVAASIASHARKTFGGVLFASSVLPQELAEAVAHGADVAELGNYDALYARGEFYTAAQVAELAHETVLRVRTVNPQAKVCVTVPGHLDTQSQQALAADLEAMGVAMLQTEGAARLLSTTQEVASLTGTEKAALTLRNTRVLAQASRLPVIAASGVDATNASEMIAAGAAGIGVGSSIRSQGDMVQAIGEVAAAIQLSPMALAV